MALRRMVFPIAVLCLLVLVKRLFHPSAPRLDAKLLQAQDSTQNAKDQSKKASPYLYSWHTILEDMLEADDDLVHYLRPTISSQDSNRPSGLGAVNKPLFTERFPVTSLIPLPTGQAAAFGKIQYDFEPEDPETKLLRESRLNIVKEAMVHASKGYMEHAWLKDEVAPVTGGYRTTLGGWALTLIDSLDLLWIMGMKDEFENAVTAISRIDFNKPDKVPLNVFEITIRYLGGLLGAYDVSEGVYPILLEKAVEVGEVRLCAIKLTHDQY
jgi:Glycosyl hydrolase family 47